MQNDFGNMLLQRLKEPNKLYQTVERLKKQHFESLNDDDISSFPRLTEDHLKLISLGSYQVNNAIRYCQLHKNRNNDTFPIFVCKEDESRKLIFSR